METVFEQINVKAQKLTYLQGTEGSQLWSYGRRYTYHSANFYNYGSCRGGNNLSVEFIPIYTRRINDRLFAHVGQFVNTFTMEYGQFLTLSLEPTDAQAMNGSDLRLCLGTWRKINKWLTKLKFLEPRRLTAVEKRIVDRKVAQHLELKSRG